MVHTVKDKVLVIAFAAGRLRLLFVICMLLLLACGAGGCSGGNETDRLLADIEDKIYDHGSYSDSARLLVDSICRATSLSRRGEALKNLILSQTNLLPNITQDNDSIESQAVDYFENTRDLKLLMRAQIERGYARIHIGELDKAIYDALDALQYASSVNDSLGVGKAELLLANIYREGYRSDLSIPHREKAVELLRKSGRVTDRFLGTQYALIAWDYHNIGDNERSIFLLDSLLATGEFTNRPTVAFMRNTLMYPYVVTGQFDKARQQFDSIRGYYTEGRMNEANWDIIIQMFMGMNHSDSVRYYLNILKDNYGDHDGNWHYYELSHRIEADAGDYKRAYHDLLKARNIMDSRVIKTNKVSPEVAEKDYWDLKAKESQEKEVYRKKLTVVIFMLLIIVIACGIALYFRIKAKHRLELDDSLYQINDLKNQIERFAVNVPSRDVVNAVLSPLDKLGRGYCINTGLPYDSSKELYADIQKTVEGIKSPAYLDNMVAMADLVYNGIITELVDSQQWKGKVADLHLIALKLMGFSPKSISFFLGVTPAAYYTRLKRVRCRIAKSSFVEKDLLMSLIG